MNGIILITIKEHFCFLYYLNLKRNYFLNKIKQTTKIKTLIVGKSKIQIQLHFTEKFIKIKKENQSFSIEIQFLICKFGNFTKTFRSSFL